MQTTRGIEILDELLLHKNPAENNSEDIATAFRRKVDMKIANFEADLLMLKACRNDSAPIFKLSIDVFSYILDLCRLQYDPFCEWIAVTHVCKRWRDVALNTPTLWNKIQVSEDARNCYWGPKMLQRSKEASIEVSWMVPSRGYTGQSSDFIRSILKNNISRIHHLSLSTSQRHSARQINAIQSSLLKDITPRPLPRLVVLHLSDWGPASVERANNLHIPTFIEECLALTPDRLSLRSVSVACIVDWESRILNADLHHLEIRRAMVQPSFEQFFHTVCSISSLRSLILRSDSTLPAATATPVSKTPSLSTSPISLERMRHLYLFGSSIEQIANVLQHARPSPLAKLEFYCDILCDSNTYSELFAQFAEIYKLARPGITFRGLRLEFTMDLQVELQAAACVQPQPSNAAYYLHDESCGLETDARYLLINGPPLRSSEILGGIQSSIRAFMEAACRSIPCLNLSVLWLGFHDFSDINLGSSYIFDGLGLQPDLHTIFISGEASSAFFEVLLPAAKIAGMDGLIRFPSLKALHISGWEFNLQETQYDLLLAIKDCALGRSACKVGLEMITFTYCKGFTYAMVKDLEDFVSSVIWDGNDYFEGEDESDEDEDDSEESSDEES